ncbi:MAG: LacI family DNA-binding transcriptional regulator [Verrucomicrobiota bacterium]
MNGRITMGDVAKRAGVHVTTVSLALRNHASLPPATRDRLRRLAEKMGYRPDPALSALVAYRHRARLAKDQPTLAYVTNWDTQWGWREHVAAHRMFFEGATAKAALLGYRLEHFWLGERGLTPRRLSDILAARGITGVILASHRLAADVPLDFDWLRLSAVKIDFFPREPAMHNVTNDQRAVIQMAVRRAREAGYRRIGLVMPTWWDEIVDLAWSAGFLAEQQALPAAARVPILLYDDPERECLVPRPLLAEWLRRHQPEAIVSYEPFVRPQLAALGVAVPQDVAFADIFLTKVDGRTAGVRQNCHRVGELAVEILAGQLHQNVLGLPGIPISTLVEGTWFEGTSLPACPAPVAWPAGGIRRRRGGVPARTDLAE